MVKPRVGVVIPLFMGIGEYRGLKILPEQFGCLIWA
jgi:hypothetical protein